MRTFEFTVYKIENPTDYLASKSVDIFPVIYSDNLGDVLEQHRFFAPDRDFSITDIIYQFQTGQVFKRYNMPYNPFYIRLDPDKYSKDDIRYINGVILGDIDAPTGVLIWREILDKEN